ncbi:MAG: immunoglobulin domain-containing protein [Verrucomicrobia bacterium]|nr:immunoglobulin domain-containing protein [Verrucomicrobiota bacterium]
MNPKPILACLLGATFAGMQPTLASLSAANGNFETGGGSNITNVTDWFDHNTGTSFWQGAWQTNASSVTPNATNVVVLSNGDGGGATTNLATPSADANVGCFLYQSIGTAEAGQTSLQVDFGFGQPDDDPGGRTVGVTVGIYAYDGLGGFTPADNTDVRGASGVTFLGSQSFSFVSSSANNIIAAKSATFDISAAGTKQLFLRFNNYRPASTQSWSVVDNVVVTGVAAAPTFSIQPSPYTGSVGANATLTASAVSTPAPTYQWQYSQDGVAAYTNVTNGGAVSGATTNTLSLNPAAYGHNGYYRVVASNGTSTNSNPALVTLTYPVPVITSQPASGAVQVGSNVSLTVAATGLGTLGFQWHSANTGMLTDGGSVSGATTATLTLSNAQLATADSYYCVITDHKATEDGSGQPDTTVSSTYALLEVFETSATNLLSIEPFSAYPTGVELDGQNPAIAGYVNPWVDAAWGDILPMTGAGSLAYGGSGYLAGIGGKVGSASDTAGILTTNSGRAERLLATNLKGTALSSRTLYLSWLFQAGNEGTGTAPNNYQVLGLWNGTSANDALRQFEAGIALGDFGTANFAFRVNNNNTTRVNLGVAPDANVHLFVAKFVFGPNANSDSVTVWLDPALGAGEPMGGALVAGVNLAFDRLTLSDYAGDSSNWDEIRWGATFDSVTVEAPAVPLIPEFTLQPSGYSGHVGDTVTLASYAEGDPAPAYQWQFDAGSGYVDLPGETNPTLAINSATYAKNGYYQVIARNVNGDATSEVAFVHLVYPSPAIGTQPAPASGLAGANVQLSVSATGLGNLGYQWYKVETGGDIQLTDGGKISGATTATLQLTGIAAGDAGGYYVIISDDAAVADQGSPTTRTSSTASVTVIDLLVTASATTPTPDADDQSYLPGMVDDIDNIGGTGVNPADNDFSTYIAADRASQGMTFTTGNDSVGYSIQSITVRMVQLNNYLATGTFYNIQDGDTFEFQFGSISGGVKTPIFDTNSAQYTGSALVNAATPNNLGSGQYLTFDLSGVGIGTLSPNTTYYFEITSEIGDPFFELSGTKADGYAGGTAFRGTTTKTIDSNYTELTGDRAFHVALTGLGGPADDFASWIGGYNVGAMTGFNQDADGDGIANGLENLFGTNPSAASKGITQVSRNGNTLTFQHPRNGTPASDVSAAYEWSTDLATFHGSGASDGTTTVSLAASPDTPVVGTTTVTATITGTVPGKLFVVLKATRVSP